MRRSSDTISVILRVIELNDWKEKHRDFSMHTMHTRNEPDSCDQFNEKVSACDPWEVTVICFTKRLQLLCQPLRREAHNMIG